MRFLFAPIVELHGAVSIPNVHNASWFVEGDAESLIVSFWFYFFLLCLNPFLNLQEEVFVPPMSEKIFNDRAFITIKMSIHIFIHSIIKSGICKRG